MSALRKWAWVIGGGIAAMALAFGGPLGCSDDATTMPARRRSW
jgi:hypothetical protein